MPGPSVRHLAVLLALSGAAALCCEVVWMRRLALATGSSGVAVSLTLGLYMAGLGAGGAWGGRRRWRQAPAGYGLLEICAALWAVAFPALLAVAGDVAAGWPPAARAAAGAAILLPPAFLAGATLPAAGAAVRDPGRVGTLYATNTAGAVVGVLAGPFLLLPALGVRGTELVGAGALGLAGLAGLVLARRSPGRHAMPAAPEGRPGGLPLRPLVAVAVAGCAAMALEVVWTRLAALLLGASVHAMAVVLAVFLACVAFGAALGRRGPPEAVLAWSLVILGLAAVAGAALHRWLPHGLAGAWDTFGEAGLLPVGGLLLIAAMGGAPVASGATFTAALRCAGGGSARAAGRVLAANTAGGLAGALATGLVLLPLLGIHGVVSGCAALAGGVGVFLLRDVRPVGRLALAVLLAGVLAASPRWDGRMWAPGVGLRLSEFADLSPAAVEDFVQDGWSLLFYEDGRTATVAVGESTRTGNRWLSINGKVDASTGWDMRTQEVSGWLPVQVAASAGVEEPGVLVVGLASGVTAAQALAAGAGSLVVVELEPQVVRASALFGTVNHDVLRDPRTSLVVDDARAWLARPGPPLDVIVSEPSNPWITGVSNLFTREYWELGRRRLGPQGVFCQWVQLYGLPPDGLRSLVATFLDVFPRTWFFETIPGSDGLLVAAPDLPPDLGEVPLLGPGELARFAAGAPRNTDDRPWVEFEAPRWLHRQTGGTNRAELLQSAGAPDGGLESGSDFL